MTDEYLVGAHGLVEAPPLPTPIEKPKKKRRNTMVIVMLCLAAFAMLAAAQRGLARQGFVETAKLLLQVGPVLIPAFVLAGMMSVVITPDAIGRWLGSEGGLRGLILGTAAGAITPGGPFVAFPLLAVLLKGGASVGAVTAYLSAWALLGVHRVIAYEIPILGWRFVAGRLVASMAFPVVIGWIAQMLWDRAQP